MVHTTAIRCIILATCLLSRASRACVIAGTDSGYCDESTLEVGWAPALHATRYPIPTPNPLAPPDTPRHPRAHLDLKARLPGDGHAVLRAKGPGETPHGRM